MIRYCCFPSSEATPSDLPSCKAELPVTEEAQCHDAGPHSAPYRPLPHCGVVHTVASWM